MFVYIYYPFAASLYFTVYVDDRCNLYWGASTFFKLLRLNKNVGPVLRRRLRNQRILRFEDVSTKKNSKTFCLTTDQARTLIESAAASDARFPRWFDDVAAGRQALYPTNETEYEMMALCEKRPGGLSAFCVDRDPRDGSISSSRARVPAAADDDYADIPSVESTCSTTRCVEPPPANRTGPLRERLVFHLPGLVRFLVLRKIAESRHGPNFRLEVPDPRHSRADMTNSQSEVTNSQSEVTNVQPDITDPEPEVTNPQPEVTNSPSGVTDPSPGVTDSRPDVTDTPPDLRIDVDGPVDLSPPRRRTPERPESPPQPPPVRMEIDEDKCFDMKDRVFETDYRYYAVRATWISEPSSLQIQPFTKPEIDGPYLYVPVKQPSRH